jgi:hypothetical protein
MYLYSTVQGVCFWFLKNLVLEVCLSVECERFYKKVSEAQTAYVLYMKSMACTGTNLLI